VRVSTASLLKESRELVPQAAPAAERKAREEPLELVLQTVQAALERVCQRGAAERRVREGSLERAPQMTPEAAEGG
jgi:hypothetical protein